MFHKLRSAATSTRSRFKVLSGFIKEWLVLRGGGHITDENTKNPATVCQNNISVDLQIGFSAVADENELAIGEIS
jgi:hypothetical protein